MAENRELALVLRLVADQFQSELRNSQGALSSFNNFIKDWRTQLAAASTALFAVAKSAANYGDELFKTSQKVGIQVEALAGLQHAARLADVDNRQLQVGLQALSRAMVDSAQGTGEGKEAFARIGVSATDATGKLRPMQDVLLDMADVFSRSADGAGKTEVAMKLLGKSGAELIPLLNSGKAGIQELMAEAERLGVVISQKDAAAAEQFNDALTRLETQAKGLSLAIGNPLLPTLTELATTLQDLTSSTGVQFFFQGLSMQAVLFSNLIKELGANVDFLMGKFTFDQLGTKIKQLEAETEAKLMLIQNPEAEKFLDGPLKETAGREVHLGVSRPGIATEQNGFDQLKYAKDLNEIWQSGIRALEIRKKLLGEELDIMFKQEQVADEILKAAEAAAEAAEDAEIEAGKGRFIVRATQEMLAAQEQERLGRQIVQQTQAQLSIDAQRAAESMTFFDHWQAGLQKYLQDTQSGFGFAADMARRTAQMMEGAFRTFFFDLMDNKIKSLKDLFSSFANFAKQIIAQVMASIATAMVLNGVKTALGGGFGAAKFAAGGPVLGAGNHDSVRALLTPGEGVLNRKGMQALAQLNSGSVTVASEPKVFVNIHGVQPGDQPQINYRRQFEGMVVDVFLRNRPTLLGSLG